MKIFSKRTTRNDDQPVRRRMNADDSIAASKAQSAAGSSDLSARYTFRRNRTLTGSSSAHVMSTNELNAEFRSPRAHVHHLSSLRRRLLGYLTIVGLASFGVYLLLAQLVATESIQIKGVALLSAEDARTYQTSVEAYYGARPAERLRFLLNQEDLLHHIQSSHPEIESIEVMPGGNFGEALVTMNGRKAIARWSIDGSNKYVDAHGIVFSRSYYGDPGLQIIDNSGLQASSDQLVASNRFLGFVGHVVADSAKRGLDISAVTIPTATTRQISVSLAGKKTTYKLSVDRSAGQQVEDIAHVNAYLTRHGIVPGYVDVRVAGKAYYK